MNRDLNPGSLRRALELAVAVAVFESVYGTVHQAVHESVNGAVRRAVDWDVSVTVDLAVLGAFRVSPPHPNLQRFIGEVRQAQEGAA